jgi:hypothetical protein
MMKRNADGLTLLICAVYGMCAPPRDEQYKLKVPLARERTN